MDTPVVLSHHTAWLFHHAPHRFEITTSKSDYGIGEPGLTPQKIVQRVRKVLRDCGIHQDDLEYLDILVPFAQDRVSARSVRPHVFGSIISARHLVPIVPGLMVVAPAQCFLQAASWMSYLELIEFGFELCGSYEIPLRTSAKGYIERPPLTTRGAILEAMSHREASNGLKLARRALRRIRGGSRSPMETATTMMIVLDRRYGGLGYRGIQLNQRIDVPHELRYLTSSSYFELDVYAKKARLDIEYNGSEHAQAERQAHDAERLSTLNAMGITVKVLTKGQFAEQLSLNRALNAIARSLGIRPDTSAEFQRAQNDLRLFVIRTWNPTPDARLAAHSNAQPSMAPAHSA